MKLYFLAVPFAGINILLSLFFTSTDQAVPAQAISISRGFALIIPSALLLARIQGMNGVWLSFPLTELLVLFMGAFFLLPTGKRPSS